MAAKYNAKIVDPGVAIQSFFGDPKPQYVPLSDVAFGPPNIVLPHALPNPSQVFPAPIFNKMQLPFTPAIGSILDEDRNGVTF